MRALLTLLALCALAAPARAETRRLALVVGNNAGAGELPPLRFAEADAGKVARVLVELGQVAPDDLYLLQGRPLRDVEQALALLSARVAEVHRLPDARAVLLFFFSGHSDGEALELGRERLPFARLKSLLAATGAEVRVSFIDACKSGAAILAKGGRPAPGFTLRLSDELNARGEAMLTSSASDELALESREVMGSFFTHHLVSGLRGGADASGDGQVTLAEAYRYAYDQTLAATAATLGGTQHPAYDYRLSGQGELILTVLQRASAVLELPPGLERALVVDLARDQVVAELGPAGGRAVALTPGRYGVRALAGGRALGGRFPLLAGQRRAVALEELSSLEVSGVAAKGEPAAPPPPAPASIANATAPAPAAPWHVLAVGFGAGAAVARGVAFTGALRLAWEPAPAVRLTLVGSLGRGLDGAFAEYGLHLRGGFHFHPRAGPVTFLLGLEVGPGVLWQTASGTSAGQTLALAAGPRGGVRVDLGRVVVTAEGEALGALASIDGGAGVAFLPAGHLSVGLRL